MATNMLPIQPPVTVNRPTSGINNKSKNWWTPLFGWSSEPDYIDTTSVRSDDVISEPVDKKRVAVRKEGVNFSEDKARKLRMLTSETVSFHDKMYHSAIASRLASDFSNRTMDL